MTKEQLAQDIEFLAKRQLRAGSFSFRKYRDTGTSSNSIVAITYGVIPIKEQIFPVDSSDMRSCENMWEKLPEHRKTGDGLIAMEAARNCIFDPKNIEVVRSFH